MTEVLTLPTRSTITIPTPSFSFNPNKKYPGHILAPYQRIMETPDGLAVVSYAPVFEEAGVVSPPPPQTGQQPASGIKVGPLAWKLDFKNDPTAFNKVSHSWFNGATQNGAPTSAANAVQGPNGIDLWWRNGAGSSINTNPSDAAAPGFTMGAGYLEFLGVVHSIEGGAPSINFHGPSGANNGPPISGNWFDQQLYVGEDRLSNDTCDVYYNQKNERSFAITTLAQHYAVANVGLNGWAAWWSDGQNWPVDNEIDDIEMYGTPGGPEGIYATLESISCYLPA